MRTTTPRPRVLCVDDEPAVLEGLELRLRRTHDVVTAASGAEGLARLAKGPPFAVAISDLRMPGMDGIAFLGRARALAPDTVRVLLTGHADLEAALEAVNLGSVFRFLVKPCDGDVFDAAVDAAVDQHRLLRAERDLLESTLAGAIRALSDVLALAHPVAFGRAMRLRRTVSALCERLGVGDRWYVEVAAELSQLGALLLPPLVTEKLHDGRPLQPAEQALVDRLPELSDQLLAHIPRLERVREVLAGDADRRANALRRGKGAGEPPFGTKLLAFALDLDVLESQGLSAAEAVGTLERRGNHDRALLDAMAQEIGARGVPDVRELPVADLRVGMVLVTDVRSTSGALLVARGYTVTVSLMTRLRNLVPTVVEPIRVLVHG